ncbi:hypothetical protein FB45DRAFT_1126758 [Roridomyces roridus]|uniref:Uncharacterized protein n=1 Tax=Roridomyces roridus TaxID=1738132 RepID=A0AAD7F8T7_9AGAR|nr:hypothetical protein FB45DRAFT_1126758 [Roridomyces roridus]
MISSAIPATRFLAPMLGWAADRLLNGVATVSYLIVVFTLSASDADTAGHGVANSVPTPEVLEAGTATASIISDSHPYASHSQHARSPRLVKAVSVLVNGIIVVSYMSSHRVVSIRKSITQNVLGLLMFFLRGMEVNFIVFIALVLFSKCFVVRRTPVPMSELPTVALVPNQARDGDE